MRISKKNWLKNNGNTKKTLKSNDYQKFIDGWLDIETLEERVEILKSEYSYYTVELEGNEDKIFIIRELRRRVADQGLYILYKDSKLVGPIMIRHKKGTSLIDCYDPSLPSFDYVDKKFVVNIDNIEMYSFETFKELNQFYNNQYPSNSITKVFKEKLLKLLFDLENSKVNLTYKLKKNDYRLLENEIEVFHSSEMDEIRDFLVKFYPISEHRKYISLYISSAIYDLFSNVQINYFNFEYECSKDDSIIKYTKNRDEAIKFLKENARDNEAYIYALKSLEERESYFKELEALLNKDSISPSDDKINEIKSIQSNTLKLKAAPKRSEVITPRQAFSRNSSIADQALKSANYKCEHQINHETFISGKGIPYMEAHHLVPMNAQEQFEWDLDIPENLFSLCPMCHREIHHGNRSGIRKIVTKLYNDRGYLLPLSLEEILELYYK
ncbi:hypothetical protein NON08_12185 [Cetobacterium somerae]|uniref:HNH endonuclease n=1 Tax=Cetobacterium sp. NK01 TaxID=2993530 RepID=UPI0021162B8B|nr:hypothetical protein [Cetobacterium sp. NK01]MCQ8213259.1 hypothetical protein [Cetobacterium sp. NK01]